MLVKNRFHVKFFALYIILLPIATSLSGFIGSISFLNYVAIAYIGTSLINQRFRLRIRPSAKSIYAYLLYFTISMLWNFYFSFNWYIATTLVNTVIMLIALSDTYSMQELTLLKKSFLASLIVAIILTIINIESVLSYRLTIVLFSEMDPNDFACGLLIIVSLLLEMLSNREKPKTAILALGMTAIIILLSGSRGAMLMFAGIFAWWFIICFRDQKFISVIIIAVGVLFIAIISAFLPDFLQGRLSISNLIADGGSGRIKIWKSAFVKFAHSNPLRMLIGYGYGSFEQAVNYIAVGHLAPYKSHNIFINALIEGGLIGLFLMINMFFYSYKIAKRNNNIMGKLAVVGLAIAGCTLDMQAYRIFAIVFIVAIICKNKRKKKCKKKVTVKFL